MKMVHRLRLGSLGLLMVSGSWVVPAPARTLPASIELGRDANGQPCVATRAWSVGASSTFFEEDQGYSITCRGVAAARVQGYVEVPSKAPAAPADDSSCAPASVATIEKLGQVAARRCFDPLLQANAIDVRAREGKDSYHGVAVETALAPLEALLRVIVADGKAPDANDRTAATLDVSKLAAVPNAPLPTVDIGERGLTAQAVIARGLSLIHSGRRVEASRLLNDAISEYTAAPLLVRAELRMTAGLSDSNISQFESAKAHFSVAQRLIAQAPDSDAKANLEMKRGVYVALDATNRRAWREALAALDLKRSEQFPLSDPVVLSEINRPGSAADPAAAINVANAVQLDRLVLEAETNWTRSLSYLGLGQIADSRAALDRAAASVRALQLSRVQSGSIAWLRAGIERQLGRIEDRAGNNAQAIGQFDCAIATMQNTALPTAPKCLFEGTSVASGVAAASPTVIAEAQLERAKILANKPGITQAQLLAEYDNAVDTLTADSSANGSAPMALAGYLDTLIQIAATKSSPELEEKYFKALQATGEPAVAREVVRLQSVVAQNASVQSLLADRTELERQVVRLRYEIQAVAPDDSATLEKLTTSQRTAQNALNEVNAKIAPTLSPVDEKPVLVADVRALLKPGEVYLKFSTLNGAIYAAAIGGEKMAIYRVNRPAVAINMLAVDVLKSARSFVDASGQVNLRAFAVDKSRELFDRISGPARDMLTKATTIAYDPVGELRNLPAALLVTRDSPPATPSKKARTDYSNVAFLGRQADLATALSPRSFIVTRAKTVVNAPRAFLGLGETAYAPVLSGNAGARLIQLAPGCRVSYASWASAYNGNTPISAREISASAAALGLGSAPMMTGADFSDANLEQASASGELSQYQILHFATHGLTAQPFPGDDCDAGLPPSLLTTLLPGDGESPIVSNGLLSFDQVAGLRLNANLVFLSACETAAGVSEAAGRLTGQEDSTPSLDGLVRAFLAANARTVVATLWSVPATEDTDDLIESFYRNGRADSIATSLRTAQMRLMDKPSTSHPYFWAAYFVVGDGSKQMLGKAAEPQRVAAR